MLEIMYAVLAVGLTAAGGGGEATSNVGDPSQQDQQSAAVAAVPLLDGFDQSVVPQGLVAEPQVPSGKFTTAQEVKPILAATRASWIAVREYGGQDLLYVTHLWAWRCGLAAVAVSINKQPYQDWPLPACHMEYATPNAILDTDGLPYVTHALGSIQTIDVQIVYDDLSMERADFERSAVLLP